MPFWRRGVAAVVSLAAAPGAPGQVANWTEGDKDGFGTATALESRAWFTLDDGELGWTHAQFVRLAWSIDAGRPVERPAIVACRYARVCD